MRGKSTSNRSGGMHEPLETHAEVRMGSERAFGLVFAVVFALIGLLPVLGARAPHYGWLAAAATFLAVALAAPGLLAPLNRLWFRFGLLLHRIVNPLIMGLLFYLVVTPTGLVMRLLGKDILHLKADPRATSYWTRREPPGPARDSFKNQF